MLSVDLLKTALIHMRVNLSGRNAGVPQHFLDMPQIRTARQEVGGETVPHRVGAYARWNPSL